MACQYSIPITRDLGSYQNVDARRIVQRPLPEIGIFMNLQPELNYCPECEAKLEYDSAELVCPNCGWEADEAYVQQYKESHGY